jgi:hypothetical protein
MPNCSFQLAAVAAAVLALVGCGGHSSDTTATSTSTSTSTSATPVAATLTGQAYKGPTAGATLCAYAIDSAAADKKGAQVAAQSGSAPTVSGSCVVTANDGSYTFVLPAGTTGSLLLESSGGTYCNDESLFDGTSCAGGGLPVAMGAAKLSTVVAAPGAGLVANAPLTLLTTAATRSAGTADASTFKAAYGTVAGNFGVADTDPASDPKTAGALNTVLASLTTYLGADTTLVDSIVGQAADGTLKTGSAQDLEAQAALSCSALTAQDLSYTYTYMGMYWDPVLMMMMMMPQTVTASASALGTSTCKASEDGQSSSRFVYYINNGLGSLLNGGVLTGTYYYSQYSDATCGTYASYASTPMTLQYAGNQTIPLSASSDPTKSQAGTASKLTVTLLTGGNLGLTSPRTENHLFCRTQASAPSTYNFKGYLTSPTSPMLNGSLSRLDSTPISMPATAWWD